jgi:drug/metabolite transporter (DMT)-like permease
MLVLAALSWGLAIALTKVALDQLAPLDLLGLEVATALIVLWTIALARGGGRPKLGRAVLLVPVLLLIGVVDPGVSFLFFDIGVAHTAATSAALLIATESLFTAGLAVAFLGERLNARLAFALATGFAGAALVSLRGGGASSLEGDLLVVGASLAAAVYGVLARHLAPGREVLTLTVTQMLGAAAVCLPLAALAAASGHSRLDHANAGHLLVGVAVGVLAGVVPFLLFNAAIKNVTATAAGLVLTLIPLFGAAASVTLLSESLAAPQLLGGALIVLAATLATLSERTQLAGV